ncbi:methyltransferase [Proteus vulgaris]|uniref:methyltransferase n=1 Tax=Proteus vulgaris TaxID=585 RepID=UPI0018E445ED|nr:methyltransferase [Proteus vulgaris]MBI6530511.1 methyltransferase [Proteus vulgaris]
MNYSKTVNLYVKNSAVNISSFLTKKINYQLDVDKFICNKFGLAEFFADKYELLNFKNINNVLDVGAGAGPISLFLSHQYNIKTTAIEINPIAYNCCLSNINKYKVKNKVNVINADFSTYRKHNKNRGFDLIVSNPPLRNKNSDPSLIYQLSIDEIKNNIDSSIYSFLTNSWCDQNQLDLLDHIFLYYLENYHKQTYIVLVCCDIEFDSIQLVTEKTKKYGLNIIKILSGDIKSSSIGTEGLIDGKILSHIIVIRKL